MAEGYDPAGLMNYLPPEILKMIIEYLPAKDVIRCREVNEKWRAVVDSTTGNHKMWRRHCKKDFAQIYKIARRKARSGLGWFNLYRSMSFWKLLKEATGIHEELCSASNPDQEIRNFKILDDGIIGVLKRGSIVYYDTTTLDLSHRPSIFGYYSKYVETENVIVMLNNNLRLLVIRKVKKNEMNNSPVSFYNVKLFTLAGEQLYFVNLNDEIFVIYWRTPIIQADILVSVLPRIMTIGYSNGKLHVLTASREIYTIEKNNRYYMKETLYKSYNVLRQMQNFHLLENVDWLMLLVWIHSMNRDIPADLVEDISVIKQYGDILFVGTRFGVLRIYYGNGGLDILHRKPMREFDFNDHNNAASIWCPILNVDVIEMLDGHTVFVAMPQKISVLKLKHKLTSAAFRTSPQPMLAEISELPEERDSEAAGTSGSQDRHRQWTEE